MLLSEYQTSAQSGFSGARTGISYDCSEEENEDENNEDGEDDYG